MNLQTPTLDKHFNHWMDCVFGPGWRTTLPEIEREERKRAFFSGFASCFMFTLAAAELPHGPAEAQLDAAQREIKSYFAQMRHVPKAGVHTN